MGWQDRSYYRDSGASPRNPLMWLLSGSVPLFTAFRIRVRLHASMIVLIVLMLISSGSGKDLKLPYTLSLFAVLIPIVLLHEFGHCFGARAMGGDAEEVILSPIGGLALTNAPQRPWAQFVTVACGPLVNVAICLLAAMSMAILNRHNPSIPLNPLSHKFYVPQNSVVQYWLWFIFIVSWTLFLFNLLPIYFLDGGQMLRALLWFKLGFYRASMITAVVGMVGAALMVIWGITNFGSWSGAFLMFIGLSCFMSCYRLRAMLKAEGPWAFEDEGADYSASLWHRDDQPRKHKKLSRRTKRRLRKQAEAEESEQARIDAILAKVSAQGMHSLTWGERRALRKATERQRKREMEVSRDSF
jgi:Zn-dependent protease